MPIPSSGNIALHAHIYNEFAPLTRPDPWSQEGALDAIFGAGRTEDSIRDFAGLSRPTGLDTLSATNVDSDSATFNADSITDGGVGTGWYYFEYDTDSGFGSPSYTSTVQFNGTVNSPSANVSGLSPSTTYYYRVVAYNGFNGDNGTQGSSDHDRGDTVSFATAAACAAPTNLSDSLVGGGDILVDWNSSITPANGFEIEYNVFGSWNALTTVPGTQTQYTHQGCGTDYPSGQTVYHRVRALCSGGNSTWEETNTVNPSC